MSALYTPNPWVMAIWLIVTVMLVVPGAPALFPDDNGTPAWFGRWLCCTIVGGFSGWMAWHSALNIGGTSKLITSIVLIMMLAYWIICILISALLLVAEPEAGRGKTP